MKALLLIGGFALALALSPLACGSSDETGGGGGSGGVTSDASADGSGATTTGGFGGTAAVGGQAGSGGGDLDAGFTPDGYVPKPEPGHIDFAAVNPLPAGEQLLFNDWGASPNRVYSIKPDGSGELEIFRAYRIWSMGVSANANSIAFACGDKEQFEHYGLSIGDAIQNTWLYDVASSTASILDFGNINDECHHFSADDQKLYVCRRYDFEVLPGPKFTNKGYQLARIDVASQSSELLLAQAANTLQLHPIPTADQSELYFTLIEISGGTQTRKIMKMSLPGGTPTLVKADASLSALSPDGARILYADSTDKSALYSMKLDGSDVVKVTSRNGSEAAYSPDGSRVAFLWGETQSCNHIEVVMADGSQADAPVRVRDCGTAFITELEWIAKP